MYFQLGLSHPKVLFSSACCRIRLKSILYSFFFFFNCIVVTQNKDLAVLNSDSEPVGMGVQGLDMLAGRMLDRGLDPEQ